MPSTPARALQNAQVSIKTEWDAETPLARISVSDNGVGIDEAEVPSIFQLFASTKGSRGTGLGLPVSQKIIREHGGKISVTSRPAQGSTFVIELPATRRLTPRAPRKGPRWSSESLGLLQPAAPA